MRFDYRVMYLEAIDRFAMGVLVEKHWGEWDPNWSEVEERIVRRVLALELATRRVAVSINFDGNLMPLEHLELNGDVSDAMIREHVLRDEIYCRAEFNHQPIEIEIVKDEVRLTARGEVLLRTIAKEFPRGSLEFERLSVLLERDEMRAAFIAEQLKVGDLEDGQLAPLDESDFTCGHTGEFYGPIPTIKNLPLLNRSKPGDPIFAPRDISGAKNVVARQPIRWSRERPPQEWEAVFKRTFETIRDRIEKKQLRAECINTKAWRFDLDFNMPPDYDDSIPVYKSKKLRPTSGKSE